MSAGCFTVIGAFYSVLPSPCKAQERLFFPQQAATESAPFHTGLQSVPYPKLATLNDGASGRKHPGACATRKAPLPPYRQDREKDTAHPVILSLWMFVNRAWA
jgi:hypothetical protein